MHRPQPAVSAPTACSKSSIVTFAILVIIAFFHSLPPQLSTQLSHPTMSAQNSPLASWLQARLGALYEAHPAPDDAAFAAQFDAVFARDAKVVLNHVPAPRTAYVTKLREEHFAAVRESVEWRELIELSPADGAPGTTVRRLILPLFSCTAMLIWSDLSCSRAASSPDSSSLRAR